MGLGHLQNYGNVDKFFHKFYLCSHYIYAILFGCVEITLYLSSLNNLKMTTITNEVQDKEVLSVGVSEDLGNNIIIEKQLIITKELHGLSLFQAKYVLELVAQDLEGLSVIKSLN